MFPPSVRGENKTPILAATLVISLPVTIPLPGTPYSLVLLVRRTTELVGKYLRLRIQKTREKTKVALWTQEGSTGTCMDIQQLLGLPCAWVVAVQEEAKQVLGIRHGLQNRKPVRPGFKNQTVFSKNQTYLL
jgi:hypothetical protein